MTKNTKALNSLAKWARQNAGKGNAFFVVSTALELFGKNYVPIFTPLPNRVKALFRELKK
jgi:hypothetical protein